MEHNKQMASQVRCPCVPNKIDLSARGSRTEKPCFLQGDEFWLTVAEFPLGDSSVILDTKNSDGIRVADLIYDIRRNK
jgi:hypothetical protein